MKRSSIFIFIVALLLSFSGCSEGVGRMKTPADFFYCRSNVSFDTQNGVITSERRETADFTDDLAALVNHYLQGPISSHLRSPFPENSAVLWISSSDSELILVMNPQFTQLTDLDLSLACTCLCKTLFQLSQVDRITIRGLGDTIDEQATIVITRDSVLLWDENVKPVS